MITCWYCGQRLEDDDETQTRSAVGDHRVHEECEDLGFDYWRAEYKAWKEANGVR